jgi:hypothetical protein
MSLSSALKNAAFLGQKRAAEGDSSIATRPRAPALAPVPPALEPPAQEETTASAESVEDTTTESSNGDATKASLSSSSVTATNSRKRRRKHKRKNRSVCAAFFLQPQVEKLDFHCRLCSAVFHGKATSARKRHAEEKHPTEFRAVQKAIDEKKDAQIEFRKILDARLAPISASRSSMLSFVDRKKFVKPPMGVSSSVLVGVRKTLSFVISAVMVGLSVNAASTGFGLFFKEIDFGGVEKQEFWRYVDILYVFVFEKLQTAYSLCSSYCIGSDLWDGGGRYFLGLVLYAIDKNWNFISHLVGLVPYAGTHFAESLAAVVESRLDQFVGAMHPSPLLSASFTDGEATMKKMSQQVVDGDDVQHCPIHKLSLCFRGALGLLKKCAVAAPLASGVVANATFVIGFLRASAVSERDIADFLDSADCDALVVIAANVTRWRGIYLCLKRLVELKAAFIHATKGKVSRKDSPAVVVDENFFADITSLLPVLECGSKATLLLEGRGVGMLSRVLHVVSDLTRSIAPREGEGLLLSQLKTSLLSCFYNNIFMMFLTRHPFLCDVHCFHL